MNYDQLFAELFKGPAVLLLGQDILRQYAGEDYFLTTCQARFDLESADSYDDLISHCGDDDSIIGIWHDISNRIAVPELVESLASLPWNCVLTSSIHDVVDRALKVAEWRQVVPVLDETGSPSDPRNRFRLSLFKLFGCVTRDQDTEQPPLSKLRKLQRNSIANEMLAKLHELVTPKGTFIIDCVAATDWLKIETLVGAISRLGTGQAHWFGATDELIANEGLQLLREEQRIVFHKLTLADALAKVPQERLAAIVSAEHGWTDGVELTFPSGRTHKFSAGDWRRVSNGVTLLNDDNANKKYCFSSSEERYKRFKDFLYGTHGTPDWQAVASGMPFRRSEFSSLQRIVLDRLHKQRLNEKPILVVGQSGAGKSVALADLAILMRQQHFPVVYFGRNESDVDADVVANIAADLDRIEATPLLLVWDASVSVDAFASLASLLASLGRKVVVVGATYEESPKAICVPFAEVMSTEDAERFLKHLDSFDSALAEGISPKDFERRNFWAWLWRLLPESRGKLRIGLLQEAETYYQELEKSLRNAATPAPVVSGTFGAILAEAGIISNQSNSTDDIDIRNARGKAASQVEKLCGLILVPSAYGEDVPIGLVLRCMGREGFEVLQNALRSTPVFRWSEDAKGNHSLGARQQLEAETMVRSKFSRHEQFEFIKSLLRSVRARGDWHVFDAEVAFAINLLRSIGPDSPRSTTADELLQLADVVREITSQSGSNINPWLAFQEGYFRREALRQIRDRIDWQDRTALPAAVDDFIVQYQLARQALERAEASYGDTNDRKQKRRLSQVHTEYAGLCGIGQEIQNKIRTTTGTDAIPSRLTELLGASYKDAVKHCKKAILLDSENVNSLDVQFRLVKSELNMQTKKGALSTEQHIEFVSELCDVLGNESWDQSPEFYGQRKMELAEILGDENLKTEALAELAKAGSFAGEYLLAWRSIYYPDRAWRPPNEIDEALERIETLKALTDFRLLRLYVTAWWYRYAKVDLFDQNSERRTVGLSQSQWEHYLEWLRKLRARSAEEVSPRIQFLYAWSLFQTGEYAESIQQFRLLDQSVFAGPFRVVRLCLWSESDGKPIECSGTIRRVYTEGDKGWVYVPALRREIAFRPNDFKSERLAANQPLPDFHIAFNFRGPIADPSRLASSGRMDK